MSIKEITSTLNCKNMLECVFGLSPLDVRVYEALLGGSERVEDISKVVGRGESAVYKSLQRLLLAGMAYRIKMPLDGSGYYFTYRPTPKSKVAMEVEKIVNELCVKLKEAMEEFLNDSGSWLPRVQNVQ